MYVVHSSCLCFFVEFFCLLTITIFFPKKNYKINIVSFPYIKMSVFFVSKLISKQFSLKELYYTFFLIFF